MHILRINVVSHHAGYQVPIKNGQIKIRNPARDMANKKVAPCGEFTKSTDFEDAQLIQIIQPNSTIGAILSSTFWYRAQQIQNKIVWVTDSFGPTNSENKK